MDEKCILYINSIFKDKEKRYSVYEKFQKDRNCENLLNLLVSWNKGIGRLNKISNDDFCKFIEKFLKYYKIINIILYIPFIDKIFVEFFIKKFNKFWEDFEKSQGYIHKSLRIPIVKLLHFLYPKHFPIFDNYIIDFLYERNNILSNKNLSNIIFEYKKCFKKVKKKIKVNYKILDEYFYLTITLLKKKKILEKELDEINNNCKSLNMFVNEFKNCLKNRKNETT